MMGAENPGTSDDMLENMLKEAEVLAAKMTSSTGMGATTNGSSCVDTTSAYSKSTEVPRKERAPVIEADQGDLDEVLRQSEALLDKMKAKVVSERSATTGSEVLVVGAPTSVYVLHENSIPDDVSSVGSQSLRQAAFSAGNLASSLDVTDALNNSRYMADALKKLCGKDAAEPHPGTPIPSDPDEVTGVDYTSASSSYKQTTTTATTATTTTRKAKFQASIPDFKQHNPDAKWEKVTSAKAGDQDFVPLEDFSSEKKDSASIVPPLPLKKTRLENFKHQAKLKRKRRLRFMAMLIGIGALAYSAYVAINGKDHGLAYLTGRSAIDQGASSVEPAPKSSEADENKGKIPRAIRPMEVVQEPEKIDFRSTNKSEIDRNEEKVQEAREEPERVSKVSSLLVEQPVQAEQGVSVIEKSFQSNPHSKSQSGTAIQKVDAAVPLTLAGEAFKTPKGCKNIFFRIFRKKCRVFAREKKLATKKAAREAKIQELMSAKKIA